LLLNITNLNDFFLNKKESEIDKKKLLLIKQMGALIPKNELDRNILREQNKLLYKHDIIDHIVRIKNQCIKSLDYNGEQNLYLGTLNPKYDFALNKLHGVLGYNLKNETYILIYMPEYTELLSNKISSIFIHEYHHVIRNQMIQRNKTTIGPKVLIDYIIEEGLAENFVSKVLGEDFLNPWAKHSTLKDIKNYRKLILKNINEDKPESIYSMLYGDQELGIPLWLGYSFGYYFIKYLLQNNKIEFLTAQNRDYFVPYLEFFLMN
jgi:uncharacterized protein YjaZ